MLTLPAFSKKPDIGTGNFSSVKKCVHRITNEVFAMKVLPMAKVTMFISGLYTRAAIRYRSLFIRFNTHIIELLSCECLLMADQTFANPA